MSALEGGTSSSAFAGRNVVILAADAPREFTFQTIPQAPFYLDSTIWRYTFEPKDSGTLATESFAMVKLSPWIHAFEIVTQRPKKLPGWMQQTLERIKAVAENGKAVHEPVKAGVV